MIETSRPPRMGMLTPVLLVACALLGGCGDDGDGSTTGDLSAATTTTTASTPDTDPGSSESQATETAECLEGEGLDPSVGSGAEPGATSIDLTTEDRTIVVQIFPSEKEAAAYEASLDQEQVGYAVILGGLVPPDTRRAIVDCLPSP